MAIQNSINQMIGTAGVLGGAVAHLENQKEQVEATKENTETLDKVASEYNRVPTAGEELQNAQMATKALKSLLNSQYPYRNLKGWDPNKQLSGVRLDNYNKLTSALETAQENELTKGLEMPSLSKTLTEEANK